MLNDLMKKQYDLIEAWKLFAEQGIYKSNYNNTYEIKLWQQSKLLGAKPLNDCLKMKSVKEVKNDIKFDEELNLWAFENSVLIMLFEKDKILLEKTSFDFDNIKLEIGCYFDEKILGINALNLSINSSNYECLKGAQNYLKVFQYYITRVFPIKIIDKNYYVFTINHIANENNNTKTEIETVIEKYIDRIGGQDQNIIDKVRYFENGIYEITSSGKITYTKQSHLAILPENHNILSYFYDCSLKDLFTGQKQLVCYKNDINKQYILTPISKKNQFNLTILCEKSKPSKKLFEEHHNILNEIFSDFVNKSRLSNEVSKRLKALANSSMPVIFIIDNVIEEIILSTYISSLKQENYNYYLNLDPTKNLEDDFEKFMYKIKKWTDTDKKATVHIFNLDLISDKDSYNTINTCFYAMNKAAKYFIYISKEYYIQLCNDYPNIMSSFKLNTLKVSQQIMNEIKKAFGNKIENNKYSDQNKCNFNNNLTINIEDEKIRYSLKEIEKNTIINALIYTDYNISKTSNILDISRSTLYRKIKEYGIEII